MHTVSKKIVAGFFSLICIVCLGILFTPTVTDAQSEENYQALEELPGITEDGVADVTSTSSLPSFANQVAQIMIGIAIALAIIMLIMGGATYMTSGSFSKKGQAKSRMTQALIGLLLALGAVLILNTINPNLTSTEGIEDVQVDGSRFDQPDEGSGEQARYCFKKINQDTGNAQYFCHNSKSECQEKKGEETVGRGGGGTCEAYPEGTTEEDLQLFSDILTEESDIRETLKEGDKVHINKGKCEQYGEGNCTTVGQLDGTAVNGLRELRDRACDPTIDVVGSNCDENQGWSLTVTGGTEWWLHSENTHHKPDSGNTAVDITGHDSTFNQWMDNKINDGSNSCHSETNCTINVGGDDVGFTYETEGDNAESTGAHWHVVFPE